ncbi:hypothetical protein DEFDS_0868 [Deferribacter desulfuricans SSM1]|uniref:Uncharacterized protein n=1 Tax=Deferribacter desulfuricans (strain DSM 14783 / JCM 11476 / NBRC 101012 / SSM1) TaxID=639282 RepID=D3PCM1_DEFDS|nr:hypothetical protein [Deferribacter desulfuricans]BAI80344.1 hypothetical protein DEFDS_0868 [Deferribacter desulfuricans SSM1]
MKIIRETIPFCQCIYKNSKVINIAKNNQLTSKILDESAIEQITNKVLYATLYLVETNKVKFPPPLSVNYVASFFGINRYRHHYMLGYQLSKRLYEELKNGKFDDKYFCEFCTNYKKISLDNYLKLISSTEKMSIINKVLSTIGPTDDKDQIFILKDRIKDSTSDSVLKIGLVKNNADTVDVYKIAIKNKLDKLTKKNIALMYPVATALSTLLIFDKYIHNNIKFPFIVSNRLDTFIQNSYNLDYLSGLFIPDYEFFNNKATYSSRNIQNWPLLLFSDKIGFSNPFFLQDFGITVKFIKEIKEFLSKNNYNDPTKVNKAIFSNAKKTVKLPYGIKIKDPFEKIFDELSLLSDLRGCTCKSNSYIRYKIRDNNKEPKIFIINNGKNKAIEIPSNKLKIKIKLSKLQNRELFSNRNHYGYIVGLFLITLDQFPGRVFIKIGLIGLPINNDNLAEEKINEEINWIIKHRYHKDIKPIGYVILGIFENYREAIKFDKQFKREVLNSDPGEKVLNAFHKNTGLELQQKFNDNGGSEIFLPSRLGMNTMELISKFQTKATTFPSLKKVIINDHVKF